MKRWTVWLLTLGIIAAIVADSTDFFFHRPYYEFWDLAANSLAVDRAKHFQELYGSYSRWGFHHPGPVYFYIQALGEWLFYDLLHVCPAPFNAQTLSSLCVTTSFFVGSVAIFSRWLSEGARRWFVPAALAVGAIHFGAVSRVPSYDMLLGSSVFSSAWTAHSWVFPFLCVVAAATSVAAGRGEDLPLLAVADGFLIHAHIASPLFVGPMSLLAYAGLLSTTIRREPASAVPAQSASVFTWLRPAGRMLTSAWRTFPRGHLIALAILTLFALPLIIDLFLGDASNVHAVLMHMRSHQGEHKSLVRSLFYLAQFGAYRAYQTHFHEFKRFDKAGAYRYLWLHKKIYAMWLGLILLIVWSTTIRPALVALGRWREDGPTPAGAATGRPVGDRTRFLAWAGVFLLLSIVLTLVWGIIQDGGMFYYSGWINFAIYYFGLLIILAEFCSVLSAGIARRPLGTILTGRMWYWIERLVPAGMVAFACFMEAGRFRVSDPTPEVNRAMHESYVRAVRDGIARNPKGIKMLKFPVVAWPTLTGLALEMEREGQPFMAATTFPIFFQPSGAIHPVTPQEASLMEVWHFKAGGGYKLWVSGVPKWFTPLGKLLERQMAAAQLAPSKDGTLFYPMLDDIDLTIDLPKVDPGAAGGDGIDFRKPVTDAEDESSVYYRRKKFLVLMVELGSNPGCALYGFSEPETWGTWNSGSTGLLRFRGDKVGPSEDVEMRLGAHPFLAPDAGLIAQRLGLAINGTPLGSIVRLTEDGEVAYTVPGALWNQTFGRQAGAALEFTFPDVSSPAITHPGDSDTRLLGVGLRDIHFRAVPAGHPTPSLALTELDDPAQIDFRPGGNAHLFQSEGWADPDPWGMWTTGHTSRLNFHSKLVEGTRDVEVALKVHCVMGTDSPVTGQRVRLILGDFPLNREQVIQSAGTLVFTVPSVVWNAAVADDAEVVLTLDLPDAVSPARLDPNDKNADPRQLALGLESIAVRKVPTAALTTR